MDTSGVPLDGSRKALWRKRHSLKSRRAPPLTARGSDSQHALPLLCIVRAAGAGSEPYFSVPFYTLHKLMAGLLDQHTHAGSGGGRRFLLASSS